MQQSFVGASKNPKQFVVLGGGIVGLSCAVRLLDKYPNASLMVIGEQFTPHTTSDVAAGLWGPYVLGKTAEAACRKWAQDTHSYMHQLWRNGQAAQCGLCLVPVVELFKNEEPTPWWHDVVFGFQSFQLQSAQMHVLGCLTSNLDKQMYKTGISYVTFTCEPTKLMRYYHQILLARNVQFRKERLESIHSLSELGIDPKAIIINCLGLGAQSIAGDTELSSIRGQVQKVRAEGIFQSFANDECYIIPNTDTVTLGGTKQKSNNLSVCPVDRYIIRKNCTTIIPSLRTALLKRDAVGLRPVRSTGVRLEIEHGFNFNGPFGNESSVIVHNYGHGGAGITLAWGCAGEVVRLLEQESWGNKSKL